MELLSLGIFSAVLLTCVFTGVSVIYAMFCTKVAIVSKNTPQSEMDTLPKVAITFGNNAFCFFII